MRAVPDNIETGAVMGALADGWGFEVEAGEYAAVGGGSYHWIVILLDGTSRFVTVDDIDHKAWLGNTRDSVCEGLTRAFATALGLRDAGLDFVVAPIPTTGGETLLRIGPRHTVALFPFVDGQAGRYGHYDAAARSAVVSMLAELHLATPTVDSVASSVGLDLPGRRHLEAGLQELNQPWSVGRSPSRHDKRLPVTLPTWPRSSPWQTVSLPRSSSAAAHGSSPTGSRTRPT